MAEWRVYVKTYDDADLLKGCVDSIPDGIPVDVLDGRYADFEGGTLRTPGLGDWCADQPDVTYHMPRSHRLPWGHDSDADPQLRAPIYEQAKYANYEMLPQDEWVLHMDADERLERFDVDLDALDPRLKVMPWISSLADRNISVPRLYQPGKWTFWIAGVMYPREFVSRETSLEQLAYLHAETELQRSNRIQMQDSIRIRNVGEEDRPAEYHERRADQLETMGRLSRARQYREEIIE